MESNEEVCIYEVKPGDSLSAIAAHFGYVTPTQIARTNQLTLMGFGLPPVFPGQRLIIPANSRNSISPAKIRHLPGVAIQLQTPVDSNKKDQTLFPVQPFFYTSRIPTLQKSSDSFDEDVLERQFVKVPAKRLINSTQDLIDGVLLVTPESLCFDASRTAVAHKNAYLASHFSDNTNTICHSNTKTRNNEDMTDSPHNLVEQCSNGPDCELSCCLIPQDVLNLGLCIPLDCITAMKTMKEFDVNHFTYESTRQSSTKSDTNSDSSHEQLNLNHMNSDELCIINQFSEMKQSKSDNIINHNCKLNRIGSVENDGKSAINKKNDNFDYQENLNQNDNLMWTAKNTTATTITNSDATSNPILSPDTTTTTTTNTTTTAITNSDATSNPILSPDTTTTTTTAITNSDATSTPILSPTTTTIVNSEATSTPILSPNTTTATVTTDTDTTDPNTLILGCASNRNIKSLSNNVFVGSNNTGSRSTNVLYLRLSLKDENHFFLLNVDCLIQVYSFLLRAGVGMFSNYSSVDKKSSSTCNIDEIESNANLRNSQKSRKGAKTWSETDNRRSLVEEALQNLEQSNPIPLLFGGESSILTNEMLVTLGSNLPVHWIGSNLNLVYKSERDGYSLNTLYRKCKEVEGGVLLLIRDSMSIVFGAFLSERLRYSKHFYGTGETCVFHWKPDFKRYNWTKKNYFFMRGSPNSFHIGGQSGRNAIWFDEALKYGRSEPTDTFDNPVLSGILPAFKLNSLTMNDSIDSNSNEIHTNSDNIIENNIHNDNNNDEKNIHQIHSSNLPINIDKSLNQFSYSVPFLIDSLEVWQLVS